MGSSSLGVEFPPDVGPRLGALQRQEAQHGRYPDFNARFRPETLWFLSDQLLDTSVPPHRLDLYVEAERGSLYPARNAARPIPPMILPTRLGGI